MLNLVALQCVKTYERELRSVKAGTSPLFDLDCLAQRNIPLCCMYCHVTFGRLRSNSIGVGRVRKFTSIPPAGCTKSIHFCHP